MILYRSLPCTWPCQGHGPLLPNHSPHYVKRIDPRGSDCVPWTVLLIALTIVDHS